MQPFSHTVEHPEIPAGIYCYKFAETVTGPGGLPIFRTISCPYFTCKTVNGVNLPWCSFLKLGSVPASSGSLTDEDDKKLIEAWGLDDPLTEAEKAEFNLTDGDRSFRIPEEFGLSLLWDQCKECGVNDVTDWDNSYPHTFYGLVVSAVGDARRYGVELRAEKRLGIGGRVDQVLKQLRALSRRLGSLVDSRPITLSVQETDISIDLATATSGDLVRFAAAVVRRCKRGPEPSDLVKV
jgi:hypothetical protein